MDKTSTTRNLTPLYVDTSGWLAFLDTSDPNHSKAVEKVIESAGEIVTSDYTLAELDSVASHRVDRKALSSLIWQLWGKYVGEVLRASEDDELLAWKVFRNHDSLHPTFADCVSSVIVSKHGIKNWLSFNDLIGKTISEASGLIGA